MIALFVHSRMPVMMKRSDDKDEDDDFRRRMANSERLMKLLNEASQRISETGGIPHDEFWKRIDAKYAKKSNGQRKRKTAR